jgi:hypothetical protein
MSFSDISWQPTISAAIGTALVLYLITGAVYRVYLSPVAKFPGPKLAALTLWYISGSEFNRTALLTLSAIQV